MGKMYEWPREKYDRVPQPSRFSKTVGYHYAVSGAPGANDPANLGIKEKRA